MTKVYLGADDNAPLAFGKHKGKTPNQIAEIEPSYVVWLYESTDCGLVTKELYEACLQDAENEGGIRQAVEEEEGFIAVDEFMRRH